MEMDMNKMANELLNSPAGEKLSGKKEDIEKLINSQEGQNVRNMLSGSEENLMAAIADGDMDTLKKALTQILKTEDGAKLAEQVQKMMK